MVYYDGQVITDQIIYGVAGNWLIGKIKRSNLVPFINKHTYWLNRALTVLMALMSAVGIEHAYSFEATEGVFTLTLTGLTFWGVVHHLKQFLVAYVFQQIPYHAMKNLSNLTEIDH